MVGPLAPRATGALGDRLAITGADLDGSPWSIHFGLVGRDGGWGPTEGLRWQCYVNGVALPEAAPAEAARAAGFTVEPAPADSSLCLLIAQDLSGSLRAEGAQAGRAFVQALVERLPPSAEVALVGFGGDQAIIREFQPPAQLASGLLRGLPDAQVGTPLYDVVADGLELVHSRRAAGRMLVLVTDGLDDASVATLAESVARARDAGVPVAAVCVPGAPIVGARRLGRLADASLGLLEVLGPDADAKSAASRVADRLRPPLVLRLRPGGRLLPGPVTVEITSPDGGRRAVLSGTAHGLLPTREPPGASRLMVALVVLAAGCACLLLAVGWLAARPGRRQREASVPGAEPEPPARHPPTEGSVAALAARTRTLVGELATLQEPLRTAALTVQDDLAQWQRRYLQGIEHVLRVVDDCEKLLTRDLVGPEERQAVEAFHSQLTQALRRAGLTRIAIEPGVTVYDEQLHERREIEPGAQPPYVVARELRPGYVLELLEGTAVATCPVRSAWVRVASPSPRAEAGDRTQEAEP